MSIDMEYYEDTVKYQGDKMDQGEDLNVGLTFGADFGYPVYGVVAKGKTEELLRHANKTGLSEHEEFNMVIDGKKRSDVFEIFRKYGRCMDFQKRTFVCMAEDAYIGVNFTDRDSYSGIYVSFDGNDKNKLIELRNQIYAELKEFKKVCINCEVNWYYAKGCNQELQSQQIQEVLDDNVYPEAYPYIENLDEFINDYLAGDEQVLIFLGPPGTGKTRLIRYILNRMVVKQIEKQGVGLSRYGDAYFEDDDDVNIMYTTDAKVLEHEEFIVDFLTNRHSAMVLEDIDFNLRPRMDNNTSMYKLLASSDGLLTNRGRKMIISTNVDSVAKIDEALIRPGRCYGIVQFQKLNPEQANTFLKVIGSDETVTVEKTIAELYAMKKHTRSGSGNNIRKIGF
jgi:hypothetical protein